MSVCASSTGNKVYRLNFQKYASTVQKLWLTSATADNYFTVIYSSAFLKQTNKKSLHTETEQLLSWVSTGARQSVVCLCVQDYYWLIIVSSEKRDSPWFRSEVLNQRKKNSCNSTELTSKHLSALHLIQHNSEHSTDASTDTGAAEGPVQRFMGFFALFARHVQVFHNTLVKMDMLNKKTKILFTAYFPGR